MDIPYEKQFHFRDGTAVGSLDGLHEALLRISYEEFYHHVNSEKNDFANWVRYVLKDPHLASDLDKVSSIVETVEIINDYLHPRPVTASHEDFQSRFEEEEGIEPPAQVEEVPTTQPAEALPSLDEGADFELLEEAEEQQEEQSPLAPDEHIISDKQKKMLIVKDFIYGMIFGLIIGLLLGRILSF